ncbi:MAG: Clp protease N-terminal domain-containing protein [Leucobacter sp.]
MSKFTGAMATSHTLSLAAMEEASRHGQRTADIDHMLIALTVNEQLAGQVLRSLGITLDSTRKAVTDQHVEQLTALGITTEDQKPGPIVFHETSGYEWSKRSLEILKQAGEGSNRGDAAAVVRELVIEPSGLIEAVLARLHTTPDQVIARLDDLGTYPHLTHAPSATSNSLLRTAESFVSAPVSEVWALLANPSRMPEWELGLIGGEHTPTRAQVGDTWIVHTRTVRADGKPIRVRPAFVTQQVELISSVEEQRIDWRFRYPNAPTANTRRVAAWLEPAAGGTQLHLSLEWERGARRRSRSLLRFIMRPFVRFSLWMQLSALSAGISRAFR